MRSGLIAQKLGMTRIYTDEGQQVPVTVLKVDNCQVVAQKTAEKHGYTAVQLGVGTPKIKRLTKAERGHFAVAKTDKERGLIMVRGSVPGVKGAWVSVRDAVKRRLPDTAPKPGALRGTAVSQAEALKQ